MLKRSISAFYLQMDLTLNTVYNNFQFHQITLFSYVLSFEILLPWPCQPTHDT